MSRRCTLAWLALVGCACAPPAERVLQVGALQVAVHTGALQSPYAGVEALILRLNDDTGAALRERHFAPGEPLQLGAVDGVGALVEVVLEGYSDGKLTHRGATGLVPADGARQVGLFFGLLRLAIPLAGLPVTELVDHVAVALRDGRVLIAGGSDGSGAVVRDEVWIYDPATASFALVAHLATARAGIAAAQLGDGVVVLAGGRDGLGHKLAAFELFDPGQGVWVANDASATGFAARAFACAVTLADGRVAITGGEVAGAVDDEVTFVDATHAVVSGGALGPHRQRHGCALLGEGLVIAGADTGSGTGLVNRLLGLNTREAALLQPARQPAVLADDNGALVLCGADTSVATQRFSSANQVSLADGWSLTAPARFGCEAVRLRDGRVLVVGGHAGGQPVAVAELLDGQGSPAAVLAQTPRAGHSATLLPGGEVLILGGGQAAPAIIIP